MRKLQLFYMLSVLVAFAHAQSNKGNLIGTIRDLHNKPVESANIQLLGTSLVSFSDESGHFVFRNIPEGTYTVVASCVGCTPVQSVVKIEKGRAATVPLTLAEKVTQLKEVSVTSTGIKGETRDVPGTVSFIDNRQIQESGAQNVGQIITRVPGVNYLDEDGRGLKPNIGLRGLDPLRNRNLLVLIDGKFPIGMTYYGDPASYYMTPVQQIERIEVIKGASPVLYGGYSVGGVINMITRKGKSTPGVRADLSYGSFNAFNAQLSASANNGKTSYMISGLRRQGDSYRQRGAFAVNDISVNFATRPDSASEISFYLNAFGEDSDTPGGLTHAQYNADPRQSQHSSDRFIARRYSAAVSYKKSFGPNHHVSSSVYNNYFIRDWWIAYLNPTNNGFLRDISALGNVTDYHYTGKVLGMKNSFIAGGRIHTDRLDDINIAGAHKDARTGRTTGNKVNTSLVYEAYLYDELSITDNLTIAPGVRYTNIDYKRNDLVAQRRDKMAAEAFVYSGGLIYKLPGKTRLYATVSQGYQPPTLNSALNPGNIDAGVDLKPETSMNYEAGFRTEPVSWLSLSGSVYQLDFTNKVITESGINRNAGSSLHQGVEAELELGTWKGVSFFANGTLQKAVFTSGKEKGNILPNAPQELLAAGIRYQFPFEGQSLVLNVFGNYCGYQFSDAQNTREQSSDGKNGIVPAYKVMNATINYSRRHWGVYVNINNMLDEKYFTLRWASWNGIIPSPGRNFLAGLQLKF
jgi:Fe(3+) dicitrate transport protein